MPMGPLLAALERTFANVRRKETDQEENIWRSLPLRAAAPAFQLAASTQVATGPAGTRARCSGRGSPGEHRGDDAR